MLSERVMCFKYSFKFQTETEKLKNVFEQNRIQFICYQSNGYYANEFIVRKSGRKWSDICALINSIKSAKYDYKNKNFEIIDGKIKEVEYITV